MKYTVTQTYTTQDIYKNVEANSKEEAILKIADLDVDENNCEDTETEVEEEKDDQFHSPYSLHRRDLHHGGLPGLSPGPASIAPASVRDDPIPKLILHRILHRGS